jgi:hypothetical protein
MTSFEKGTNMELKAEQIIQGLMRNDSNYVEDQECIREAIALIRELTEENDRLIEEVIYWRDEAKSKAKGETT